MSAREFVPLPVEMDRVARPICERCGREVLECGPWSVCCLMKLAAENPWPLSFCEEVGNAADFKRRRGLYRKRSRASHYRMRPR